MGAVFAPSAAKCLAWCVACVALLGCSDEMSAMRLHDPVVGGPGVKLHLDHTSISSGEGAHADRLLLSEDGYARRNIGGNLFISALMTTEERTEMARLRAANARIDVQRHTPPDVTRPAAHRLRFDSIGTGSGEPEVRAFADQVLSRLQPETLIRSHALVVAAVVDERAIDGASTLRITRVLKDEQRTGISKGARVGAHLPDGRVGAGGATTVFVLIDPTQDGSTWQVADAIYLKMRVEAAAALVPSR